jgi:formylglycine-generating enzyme
VGLSISVGVKPDPKAPGAEHFASLISLPGGEFQMGYDGPQAFPNDAEGPVRSVKLSPFEIDAYCVTNDRFKAFVDATGYKTQAEGFGNSFVFYGHLPVKYAKSLLRTRGVVGLEWWLSVPGACWKRPFGEKSDLRGLGNHPVVHVSRIDALAYCAWAGLQLPTEAQWEYAARGGLAGKQMPWGDELTPGGKHRCNVWQGKFPDHDTGEDGYKGTCPVDAYEPNGFGLYNTSGNVWEWCRDTFTTKWHVETSDLTRIDPVCEEKSDRFSQRGGSYLCHKSYCNRYRVSARMGNTPDSSATNAGFRCAR